MDLQTRTASLLVVGGLSAGLAALASPAAGSAKGCSGYADPLNRSKSFWTWAGVEQVKACAAQFGTDAGSDPLRLTPPHLAVLLTRNPAVVGALLKGGADPNSKNKEGLTPLRAAAQHIRNPAVVAALLKGGADPTIIVNGKTPFDLAKKNKKLAGSAAYGRLGEAHDASTATRRAARQEADANSRTADADDAARESVSWRGSCSVGQKLKPGQGCRIPGGGAFTVRSDGCAGNVPEIPGPLSIGKVSMSGKFSSKGKRTMSSCIRGHVSKGKFTARYEAENSVWRIEAMP